MAKYTTYWRLIPARMIREYDNIKLTDTEQAIRFTQAINRAMDETKKKYDYGSQRVGVVKMVYIKKTHTVGGAARVVHESERTVQRWLSDFVDLVAKYSGFTH